MGAVIKRNILYHHGGNADFYNEVVEKRFPVMATVKDSDTDYNLYYCVDNPELSVGTST